MHCGTINSSRYRKNLIFALRLKGVTGNGNGNCAFADSLMAE
jgi:hypothetical protein